MCGTERPFPFCHTLDVVFSGIGAWQKPRVTIVTGAARKEGIGYSFARHLAGRHLNLVLVDVLADELAARAAELRQKYHVKVETAVLDLGQPDFLPALQAVTDKLEAARLTPARTQPTKRSRRCSVNRSGMSCGTPT